MTTTTARFGLLVAIFAVTVTALGADNNNPGKPQAAAPAADKGDAKADAKRPMEEELLQLQGMQIDNYHRLLMNRLAELQIQRYKIGNKWMEIELEAFKRLVAEQARLAKRIRDHQAQIRKQRQQLLNVLNGKMSTSGQIALARTMLQSTPTNDLTNLLATQIPAIPARFFVAESDSVLAATLNRDGTLVMLPRTLAGRSAADGIGRDAFDFQTEWNNAAEQMRNGNPVSADQMDRLEITFTKWQASAQSVMKESDSFDRSEAKNYLQKVEGLMRKVKHHERWQEVTLWISGNGFEGGSLGELVEYMASHRLSVKFGTEPHRALQQIGVLWVNKMDDDVKKLEADMIEAIKANPAHKAVVKDILRQQGEGAGDAGVKAPALAKAN